MKGPENRLENPLNNPMIPNVFNLTCTRFLKVRLGLTALSLPPTMAANPQPAQKSPQANC